MDKQLMKDLRNIDWGEYNLKEDLQICKYSLDIAAAQQPILMAKWSSLCSRAQRERDKAKERLGTREASLQKRARAGEMPGDKITEGAIKTWVVSHEDYKKAAKILREADSNVTYLMSAVRAIDAKKYMIQELDKLFLSDYYAETKIHRDTEKKSQEHRTDKAKEKLDKQMKKKAQKRIDARKRRP